MAEQMNIPAIRFKGFSGEWEERELGELADIVRGASPRPIKDPKWFDDKSTVGWLRISDVTEQDGRIHHLEQRISKAGEEKTRVLTEPHLLLSIAASVGKPVINYVQTGVHDGFLIFKDPIFNQEFMFQWMKMFEGQWQKYGQPGSQVNLNSDIIKNQDISLPKEDEQVRIGDLFHHLDHFITLHQRKHEKLVTLKKSMLKKMFPQKGATVPEIRFKGFSQPWEEKTLGELLPITSAARVHKNEWTKSGVPFFRSSDVVSNYKGRENEKAFISFELYRELTEKNGCVKEGDILVTGGGSIGIPYLVNTDDPLYFKDADLLWLKVRENVNSHYLYTFFSADPFKQYVKSISHIGTIAHYTVEQAKSTPIRVPAKTEQQKIGAYFRQLNDLISQHGTQLAKLKKIKIACLEKMFV